tara:strand:+ start:223 stop:435 length:213 start_codon:yes stop_codon:yes gene_type:complete
MSQSRQRKIQEQTEFCSSENLDPVKRGKLLYPTIPGICFESEENLLSQRVREQGEEKFNNEPTLSKAAPE